MVSAILYQTATGSCERYAREISRRLALPAYPVNSCPLPEGMEVILIGWLMNGKVQGLKKARKHYLVKAVVQVGMSPPSAKAEAVCRKKNALASDVAVFTAQGGFHMRKLSPPLRFVMKRINPGIAARLKNKGGLTPAEQATLTMAETGEGEPATWDGIQAAIDWALQERKPLKVMKWHEPQ